MSLRAISAACRLVIVFSTMLGLLLPPASASPSHDSAALMIAEAQHHVGPTEDLTGKGHVHQDGNWEEQLPGHVHGHNPFDHSHETSATAAQVTSSMRASRSDWLPIASACAHCSLGSRLDRPPKPILVA